MTEAMPTPAEMPPTAAPGIDGLLARMIRFQEGPR